MKKAQTLSPELEFRHELMGRINKLETDVELDVVPGSQHHPSSNSPLSSSGLSSYTSQGYEHYGKEFFFGNKHRDMLCTDAEDSFLRPPLWEDIASSIQNIDPENAIMLGTATMNGVPQVKMEAVDDPFLEPLASPLLSPLEIKTEKSQQLLAAQAANHNNNLSHLTNNNNNNSIHQNHMQCDSNGTSNHGSNNFLPNNGTNGYTHGSIGMYHSKYAVPQSTQSSTICPTPISRLMYVPPLTPPNSDPGSPGNTLQNPPRRTPPPPYHQQQQQQQQQQMSHQPAHPHHHAHGGLLGPQSVGNTPAQALLQQLPQPGGSNNQPTQPNQLVANSSFPSALAPLGTTGTIGSLPATSGPSHGSPAAGRVTGPRGSSSKRHSSAHSINSVLSSAGVVKHIVGRYNRRNNPELEKRRIHHCDFIGWSTETGPKKVGARKTATVQLKEETSELGESGPRDN
uniref:Uncharacterized protein n=1 Tax=Anopheles atroparvus TaxID=41427 RepID=A0A182JCI4_ANOAO